MRNKLEEERNKQNLTYSVQAGNKIRTSAQANVRQGIEMAETKNLSVFQTQFQLQGPVENVGRGGLGV